jgi:KDO2-lipid IV(A) lauroyltransferase
LCLLCDRDIQGGVVEVEFFGERTTLPAGPATMALRSGAPVIPVGVYYTSRIDGHHAVILPPVPAERVGRLREDVAAMTQRLAHDLERLIRRAPSQWHLFQPNWPSDPGYSSTP